MAREHVPGRRRRQRQRVGLVLGAGGVLGAAWMTGALVAVQERLPYAAGEVSLLAGTSAGSVLAAALRCGFGVEELAAHQQGTQPGVLSRLCSPDLGCMAHPPWPKLRVGSPHLILTALRAPRRVHPWVAAAACLPQGRAEHGPLRALVNGLLAHACQRAVLGSPPVPARSPARPPAGAGPGEDAVAGQPVDWTAGGRTLITAVDYDSGRRVAFGRPGAPFAALPDAVVASCSVPGWYRPTIIDGRRYIDGGVRSGTNADLLARSGLAEVYVLAPAASLVVDTPRTMGERIERRIRSLMTGMLLREIALLRGDGTQVTVLTPGPEDLAAIGGNLMDGSRRQLVFETALRTSAAALGIRRARACV